MEALIVANFNLPGQTAAAQDRLLQAFAIDLSISN
jgi:hypothetical protein